MLEVELCRLGELPAKRSQHIVGAAVVDLFRATSTLQVLVEGGHPLIEVVDRPEKAQAAMAAGHRCVGEWLSVTPPGFSCGNSPIQVQQLEPSGKPITFLSSNGAGALISAYRAAPVVLAANLFNLDLVRETMIDHGGGWLLVPAGARRAPCLEDDYVCGLLARQLASITRLGPRISRLVAELASVTTEDLRQSAAARRLRQAERSGQRDVEFILAGTHSSTCIPVYVDGAVIAR
jgi:2-phosphosulfolactate phosphatase